MLPMKVCWAVVASMVRYIGLQGRSSWLSAGHFMAARPGRQKSRRPTSSLAIMSSIRSVPSGMAAAKARKSYWRIVIATRWHWPWSMVSIVWRFLRYPRGGYSYPVQQAAAIAVRTVREFVAGHPQAFAEILWVLFDARTKLVYDGEIY